MRLPARVRGDDSPDDQAMRCSPVSEPVSESLKNKDSTFLLTPQLQHLDMGTCRFVKHLHIGDVSSQLRLLSPRAWVKLGRQSVDFIIFSLHKLCI